MYINKWKWHSVTIVEYVFGFFVIFLNCWNLSTSLIVAHGWQQFKNASTLSLEVSSDFGHVGEEIIILEHYQEFSLPNRRLEYHPPVGL